MDSPQKPSDGDLASYLSKFVTPERLEKMHRALDFRTRYLTVVLEDIYQPHNASAVLRSCDAFGVQDVHIVEDRNKYRVNPDVELGTSQWLTKHRYRKNPEAKDPNLNDDPIVQAVTTLKSRGYRIAATAPHTRQHTLAQLSLEPGPVALLFGTELTGLSDRAMELADEFVTIPMHGFVESFNISVSAALCLYDLSSRLWNSTLPWTLGSQEKNQILLTWLRGSLKGASALEARFVGEWNESIINR